MTPFEGSGGLLSRLPWESSLEEAPMYEEGKDREQAQLNNVMFVDFKKGMISYSAYLPLSKLVLRFLRQSPDVMTDLQHVYHRSLPRRNEQERAMARLEGAAKAGDEHSFLGTLEGIERQGWPAKDFVRVIPNPLDHLPFRIASEKRMSVKHPPKSFKLCATIQPDLVLLGWH